MVIGLKAKNHRGPTVQIDYLVHILEIKPWPPSQSLKSLRSVLIQWENGDRSSGSTNAVVPSIGSVDGEGRIEFNESFKLPVTLLRDVAVKGGVKGGGEGDAFLKNCLELNLYEPRRDKTAKGQLLATAIIDLADYGVVKECISVSAPMNSKRSIKNTDKPILYMKIQPFKKGRASSSSKESLSRGVSLDKAGGESVSALMDEEYGDEAEVASFTDDDVSSHSSQTVSSSLETNRGVSPPKDENGQDKVPHNAKHSLASNLGAEKSRTIPQSAPQEYLKGSSSCSSSVDLSSDPGSPVNGHASVAYSHSSSSATLIKTGGSQIVSSSSSSSLNENAEESNTSMRSNGHAHAQEVNDKVVNGRSKVTADIQQSSKDDEKAQEIGRDSMVAAAAGDIYDSSMEDKDGQKQEENGDERQNCDEENHSREGESYIAGHANGKHVPLGMNGVIVSNEKLKPVKSVRSVADLSKNTLSRNDQHVEVKDDVQGDTQKSADVAGNLRVKERKEAKVYPKDTRSVILESKVNQLEHRIKMLEGELREAAAVESALYSVVAEHGSSMSKVHAPARRLSRLYLHACGETSRSRRASAARSVVSGLVLVAKACGNDVPRLTFWLSNSIVLRTIISQATGDPELPKSARSSIDRNGAAKVKHKASSPLKWEAPSSGKKQGMKLLNGSFGDWENPNSFMSTLEKIESWIFSRIVESIWWQTLTPHMQSVAAKAIDENIGSVSQNNYRRTSSSVDQEQSDFSLDLWKKAFRDACERLCPVRAGGHECGCLPLLSRLVMEQSVARLDVAMFNAILRESPDEIPSDPVSDPISDLKVLPIPAGKSSFGAGAQLKSAIGNWSRWLTDLFGIDDDDSFEDVNGHGDNDERLDTSFKSFHLLNALSDLMMLPKDMLLSKSIRKEVCPTFAAPLIKRILDNFVPDEFCTDPIPDIVLETLESEDTLEIGEEALTNVPCTGPVTVYLPPSTALVASIIGDAGGQSQLRRSGSSVVRKSHTSDDELDELNSPLASIFIGSSGSSPVASKPNWVPKGNINQNAVRYELLRDVWMNSE
ncbi:putative EEIG1/EHBP1 domain-containing protein [Rosa chinensis]|uniref:Putative EEIG1/EHBP1 domain-containing protein n=1 Tax=Rosa chinensis TaxID=74649 RepID=A0A2P6S696_ROSCH|nr:uncharacterized protein LOC112187028 [Rosa chinensis]PRQ54210.1 putative EEIG1/EHBP1 domain-containing protein [Rosa chinensis]